MKLDWEWAYGPAFIEKGRIRLQKVDGYYHPFDLYYPGAENRSLYLQFAGVDCTRNESIIEFVSKHGVLDTNYRDAGSDNAIEYDIKTDAYLRLNAQTLVHGFDMGRAYAQSKNGITAKEKQLLMTARELTTAPSTVWANYYDSKGLPVDEGTIQSIRSPIGSKIVHHRAGDTEEDFDTVQAFESEVFYFKALLYLWAELKNQKPDVDGIAEVTAELGAAQYAEQHFTSVLGMDRDKAILREKAMLSKHSSETIRQFAQDTMIEFIQMQLTGSVSFALTHKEGVFTQQWRPHTLLAAMYLMLSLDLSGSLPARKCANEKCGRLFIPTRESMIYCSETCQTQDRVRRWRQRQKQGGDSE